MAKTAPVAPVAPDEDIIPLPQMFVLWIRFEDPKSDGKKITLRAVDKWMKQANLITKQLTLTDTGVAFNKFKTKGIDFKDFNKFLDDLAKQKKMDLQEMIDMLEACGAPGDTSNQPAQKQKERRGN